MKQALYYKKLKENKVQCVLCPHFCVIDDGKHGFCGARKNKDGTLYSLVYEKPSAVNVDPIEKKPLFHFYPGKKAFSFGTLGCNLACLHCQNFDISQRKADENDNDAIDMPPEEVVQKAIDYGCDIISYTYNEPTIFFEYMLDTAKIARKKGIKNTIVSNGFINPEPLKELVKYIDAANIDLKGFNEDFYKSICSAKLKPVLETLKFLAKQKDFVLEITNLVIPTKNDDLKEIEEMAKWIKENLGSHIPLHFSRFYPMYKLNKINPTSSEILIKARDIASKYLDYVYIGNVYTEQGDNTYCPKCKNLLIEREGYLVKKAKRNCDCGFEIYGAFEVGK